MTQSNTRTTRIEVRATAEDACKAAALAIASGLPSFSPQAHLNGKKSSLAVSGGRTPELMFKHLSRQPVDWAHLEVFQVDERCAPLGHSDRNATTLVRALPMANVVLMPVSDGPGGSDSAVETASYAALLPPTGIDVIHLGLGDDGHTASLVPEDSVLHEVHRGVAMTLPYLGRARMTLTTPTIRAAKLLIWLVVGESKAPMVRRLLDGDPTIPAGRFADCPSILFLDTAAAAEIGRR
jgi:6-phosphogluconolactonase